MTKISVLATVCFFGKCFKSEEAADAVGKIVAGAGNLAGRRVAILDHPPTAGLLPFIEGLEAVGAVVHLRDHHGDNPRDAGTVDAVRSRLGDRAVISTRATHPACAGLVEVGEFRDDIIVADADQDGLTAACKGAGVVYPALEQDAAVLDGPMTGKTREALSPLAFELVRAWGALPGFGAPTRDKVFADIVSAFVAAAQGDQSGMTRLAALAEEYERKVVGAKALASTAVLIAPAVRQVDTTGVAPGSFDMPTLTGLLDRGVVVTVVLKKDGPIARTAGAQVSLARTKEGESKVDLSKLVPADWAKGPEAGVISNTPFLLHLSPARWEEFREILFAALA